MVTEQEMQATDGYHEEYDPREAQQEQDIDQGYWDAIDEEVTGKPTPVHQAHCVESAVEQRCREIAREEADRAEAVARSAQGKLPFDHAKDAYNGNGKHRHTEYEFEADWRPSVEAESQDQDVEIVPYNTWEEICRRPK